MNSLYQFLQHQIIPCPDGIITEASLRHKYLRWCNKFGLPFNNHIRRDMMAAGYQCYKDINHRVEYRGYCYVSKEPIKPLENSATTFISRCTEVDFGTTKSLEDIQRKYIRWCTRKRLKVEELYASHFEAFGFPVEEGYVLHCRVSISGNTVEQRRKHAERQRRFMSKPHECTYRLSNVQYRTKIGEVKYRSYQRCRVCGKHQRKPKNK